MAKVRAGQYQRSEDGAVLISNITVLLNIMVIKFNYDHYVVSL